jgi:hypothetical protein
MNDSSEKISPLRRRVIEDMRMRKLSTKTQSSYIRAQYPGPTEWLSTRVGDFVIRLSRSLGLVVAARTRPQPLSSLSPTRKI